MKEYDTIFEAYFSGRMHGAELKDFTASLEADGQLNKAYNLYLATKEASALVERDRMRAELDGITIEEIVEDENAGTGPRIISMMKWMGGMAAVFIVSFLTYNAVQGTGDQDLFAENYVVYKIQEARGEEADDLKSMYKEGAYSLFLEEAIHAEGSPELNMMIAHAHLNMENYAEAIHALNKISDESALRDQKYWYLGLSNLKIGNKEKAVNHFNHLLSLSNFKKQEVEHILSSI